MQEREKNVESELQRLEMMLILNNVENNIISDIEVMKEELKVLSENQLEGNQFRAKAQNYFDFAKPSKFFCNLEICFPYCTKIAVVES